jgi:hypothetical protein
MVREMKEAGNSEAIINSFERLSKGMKERSIYNR